MERHELVPGPGVVNCAAGRDSRHPSIPAKRGAERESSAEDQPCLFAGGRVMLKACLRHGALAGMTIATASQGAPASLLLRQGWNCGGWEDAIAAG